MTFNNNKKLQCVLKPDYVTKSYMICYLPHLYFTWNFGTSRLKQICASLPSGSEQLMSV